MRFKKLKIAVGISTLIFILILGNILIIGSIKNTLDSATNQDNFKIAAPIQGNKAYIPPSIQQPSTHVAAPQKTNTIFHTTVRTRAS